MNGIFSKKQKHVDVRAIDWQLNEVPLPLFGSSLNEIMKLQNQNHPDLKITIPKFVVDAMNFLKRNCKKMKFMKLTVLKFPFAKKSARRRLV